MIDLKKQLAIQNTKVCQIERKLKEEQDVFEKARKNLVDLRRELYNLSVCLLDLIIQNGVDLYFRRHVSAHNDYEDTRIREVRKHKADSGLVAVDYYTKTKKIATKTVHYTKIFKKINQSEVYYICQHKI